MKTLRDCQSCLADDDIGTRLEKSSSRLLCFLALLALIGVGGCSASGPEPSFETAYSAIGAIINEFIALFDGPAQREADRLAAEALGEAPDSINYH